MSITPFSNVRHYLTAVGLVILCGCTMSGGDPAFEASLSVRDASRILRNSSNEPQIAYAVRQLDRAAHRGEERAASVLANYFRRGLGGETDLVRAAEYYEILLAGGRDDVRTPLATIYLTAGSPAHDPRRAQQLLGDLAEDGDRAAALRLARLLDGSDPARALELRQELAAQGEESAQLELAARLVDPDGARFDPVRGLEIYEELAASGNGRALYALGLVYRRGGIVERDIERSVSYFERGVVAGDERSTLQFALALVSGRGVEQSEARGLQMLEELARGGLAGALWNLGQRAPDRYAALVQETLVTDELYAGPVTGSFDADTLIALERLCVEQGRGADCAADPFARTTAQAVARTRS